MGKSSRGTPDSELPLKKAFKMPGIWALITVRIVPTLQTVRAKPGLNPMAKSARKPTPSAVVNRTVPRRAPNSELRPREYLTEKEIERLQEAARKRSRYGHRDATMILVAYRHGLRASEVCGLRWDQIDLNTGRLHVRRAKGGIDNVHPLSGREIRALRQLRRENMESRYVFVTERGGPATTAGFLKTIARTGEAARLPFRSILTCSGTPPATSWPMMGMTPVPCSTTWATRISCTRFDTPRWRLIDSTISGTTESTDRARARARSAPR